jgi:hypothetical protein
MIDFYDIFFTEDILLNHIIWGASLSLVAASALFFYEFCLSKKEEEYIDEVELADEWEIETIVWSPYKRPPRRRRQKVNWSKEGF